jgi:hypothetical protein
MRFPITLILKPTNANVFKTPDGEFSPSHGGVRSFVAKQYDSAKKELVHLPFEEVLCFNSLSLNYYRERARDGAILPGDQESANHLGVALGFSL